MKRLGVLGTFVLDSIRGPSDETPVRALGGIAYSCSAFEVRPPEGWRQLPLAKVGEDAAEGVGIFLDGLETAESREGLIPVPTANNRVELTYRGDGERTERLEGGVPGWSWDELEPLARSCDALYVNLIAGWELDLGCARRLREAHPGPLYCDLHSLLLGHDEDGVRRPRVPGDWRGWFECFDYLQINDDELALLADHEGRDPWELAEELVRDGPRALFVTLGPGGASWIAGPAGARPGAGGDAERPGTRTFRGRVAVPDPVTDGDPTGCGDVWGVACFGALLAGTGARAAVSQANRLAALNASVRGGAGLLGDRAAVDGPGRS
jgi:sugar/nucleoside kinase (ribokinase family)